MTAEVIPPELLAQLTAIKPLLEIQGVIQQRPYGWRLRFRDLHPDGYKVHRSISLGSDAALAMAVESLIERWRMDMQEKAAAAEKAEQARRQEAQKLKAMRKLACSVAGGSHEYKAKVGKWFDKMVTDPLEMLRFTVFGEFPARPKVGRPPLPRLW